MVTLDPSRSPQFASIPSSFCNQVRLKTCRLNLWCLCFQIVPSIATETHIYFFQVALFSPFLLCCERQQLPLHSDSELLCPVLSEPASALSLPSCPGPSSFILLIPGCWTLSSPVVPSVSGREQNGTHCGVNCLSLGRGELALSFPCYSVCTPEVAYC